MRTLLVLTLLGFIWGCKKDTYRPITGCIEFSQGKETLSIYDSLKVYNCSESVPVGVDLDFSPFYISLTPKEVKYIHFDEIGNYKLTYYYDKIRPAGNSGHLMVEVK